jgi:hypothetical protein
MIKGVCVANNSSQAIQSDSVIPAERWHEPEIGYCVEVALGDPLSDPAKAHGAFQRRHTEVQIPSSKRLAEIANRQADGAAV